MSPGYFELLGRTPLLGRAFLPEEEQPGEGAVAVISHGLWQGAYGADPDILGRRIELDGELVTVVGVMGPDFQPLASFLFSGHGADFWQPYPVDPAQMTARSAERHNVWVVGRLADGADRAAAELGLLEAMRRVEQTYPQISNAGSRDVAAMPMRERVNGDVTGTLLLVSMAVALLLVLTAVNVTNMLIVRAEARSGEAAVRGALGAGRAGLLAFGISESLVIGLAGGAVGLGLAALALTGLAPLADALGVAGGGLVGGATLGFSLILAVVVGLLTGVVPALRMARGEVFATLKTGRAGEAADEADVFEAHSSPGRSPAPWCWFPAQP